MGGGGGGFHPTQKDRTDICNNDAGVVELLYMLLSLLYYDYYIPAIDAQLKRTNLTTLNLSILF